MSTLGLSLAALLLPAGAQAAPAQAIPVLADDLGEIGQLVAPQITVGAQPILERNGFAATQVRFEIAWSDLDERTYAIRLYVADDPTDADFDSARVFVATCNCSPGRLEARALQLLDRALSTPVPPRPAPPETDDERPPLPPAPPQLSYDTARRRALGPIGHAGVGSLTVGVVMTATGAALAGVGETRPAEDKSEFRNLRPAGFALVGVGGAAALAGAAMLIVDRARTRKAQRATVRPAVAPRRAGVSISGRF